MFTSVSTVHFELAVDQPFPVFPHPELQTLLIQEHAVFGVHLVKKRVKFSKKSTFGVQDRRKFKEISLISQFC